MKKFFSEAHTKKCMIFLLSIVLVLSCQRDESADIGVNEVQPSTETSPRQLQNRAREIYSIQYETRIFMYVFFLLFSLKF